MQTLRQDAQAIIDKALADALPDSAVRRALERFQKPEGRLVLIAAGKAAWQMAKAAYDVLGTAITGGAVITNTTMSRAPSARWSCSRRATPCRMRIPTAPRAAHWSSSAG